MSVQVKGSGTIGGLDEGLNITGVVTATSFDGNITGTVGVGTDNPQGVLHIANTNTTVWPFSTSVSAGPSYTPYSHELVIDNDVSNVTGSFAGIYFNAGGYATTSSVSRVSTARIAAIDTGDYKADLAFSTRGTGGSDHKENLRITSDGRVLINSSTSRNIGANISRMLQIESSGGGAGVAVVRNSNNTSGPSLDLGKSRGYPNTIVQEGDKLGVISFSGADGNSLQISGAQITGEVDGTPGQNDMPGRIVFKTTADGASSTTERARITSDGYFGVNTDTPTTNLQIGDGTVDSDNVIKFGKRVSSSESNLPLIGHHSHNGSASSLALSATSSSGCIHFFTGNDADGFGDGSNNEYMRIQSNGEIAMSSNGTIGDALSGLHIQNGNLRVSQAAGPTSEYFQVQAHTHNVDGDRHVQSNYSNGTVYSHITKNGQIGSLHHHYAGRTRTDAGSPTNYYAHGAYGFHAYSGLTNDTTNYRSHIFMRAHDSGDTGDRNIIYYVNSASDTVAADYDVHQRFGVKADGSVQGGARFFSGRVESDEGAPDDAYSSARGGIYGYDTSGTAVMYMLAEAGGSSGTFFVFGRTSNNDIQWKHRTNDGRMYVDATGSTFDGADYAEYFEWSDGNSNNEDRAGYSVVLKDGDKIGIATAGDSPSSIIGVISAAPAIVGDGQDLSWRGKWKKDEFGREITTPVQYLVWNHGYEEDENGNMVPVKQPDPTHQMSMENADNQGEVGPKLDKMIEDGHVPQYAIDNNIIMNTTRRVHDPLYDETKKYVPREFRKEWSPVGLVGKLIVRKGQVMGDRWLKMKDINDQLELWMVR